MQRRWIYVLLLVLLSGIGHTALADQIVLKNGDRLTGTIVKSEGNTLVLKTDYAGDLTIKSEAVAEINSDQKLYLSLEDGRTVSGSIIAKEEQVEIKTDEPQPIIVPRASVQAIRSQAEYDTYVRMIRPGWLELWNGFADFSYSLTTGNTRTNTIAIGANLGRETRRDKTALYAALINSKNKTSGVTETTANAIRGGGRYEIKITPRLAAFTLADFEYNEIQLLDLRSVLGGGLGYSVIKNERLQLELFGGGTWNHEDFSTGLTRNSGEVIVGEDLAFRLNDRVSIKERLQFFPNLTDRGEYRLTFDAGITTKLNSFLDWHITASDRYLSNPVDGSRNNDLLLTTGLRINFRR